ncbi:tripartite tricarboxylate transporter TctB family protein [Thalassospira povalilytica]|uniref:tripartite tricarboxylate transporter TctB family protein n=1 Tax=Thalassospira povalilytica TaxID=732237 RepID=UPI003AA8BE7D
MYRFLTQNAVAIVFLLLVAAFAAASLYGSSLLPPASYEPLGSAAFPKALGLITLGLVALQVISMIRNHSGTDTETPTDAQTVPRSFSWEKYRKPALMLMVMVLYLAAMSYGGIDFRISTSVFLCVAMCLLARPDSLKKVVLIAGCSIALAVILDLVFKHLFYIDI